MAVTPCDPTAATALLAKQTSWANLHGHGRLPDIRSDPEKALTYSGGSNRSAGSPRQGFLLLDLGPRLFRKYICE